MATDIKQFAEEEELKRKIRQKKRIRGCLIVVNALLLCYFSYLAISSVVSYFVEENNLINSEIIPLNGKSNGESKKIYEEHIDSKIDVNDFATYGRYLLTSSSRVTYNSMNYEDSVWLINLLSKPFVVENDLKFTFGDTLDKQLDLFNLEQGDYMICKDFTVGTNKGVCYHYTGEELLETTIYSFPDENNHRKKITIKGKASSPALIISVEAINLLPSENYDFVIIGDKSEFNLFEGTNLQVKYVTTLKDAYLTNASYALNVIEGNQIFSSNYVSLNSDKPNLISSNGVYNSLDEDNAIRELGGYLFNSGYGVSESETNESISQASLEIKKLNKENRQGKLTLSVGKEADLDTLKNLLQI